MARLQKVKINTFESKIPEKSSTYLPVANSVLPCDRLMSLKPYKNAAFCTALSDSSAIGCYRRSNSEFRTWKLKSLSVFLRRWYNCIAWQAGGLDFQNSLVSDFQNSPILKGYVLKTALLLFKYRRQQSRL